MTRILVSIAFLALVSGCTTAQVEGTKAFVRASIANFCNYYPGAHLAFEAIAASGRLSANVIAREQQAVRAAAALCADPPTDTATAFGAVTRILAVLMTVESQAKREAGVI
jgi:hypothetical protein